MSRNPEQFERQEARLNWFFLQRTYPGSISSLSPEARGRALPFIKKFGSTRPSAKRHNTAGTQPRWHAIGPLPIDAYIKSISPTTGRVNAVSISPSDPNLILVGGATGGIWRSTNGGLTFTPVSDDQIDVAVAAIAFAKSDPSIVYAAMGDATGGYLGEGVLKSTDGGQRWSKINVPSLPVAASLRILVDPRDANRVYLSQSGSLLQGSLVNSGVRLSDDGGTTWTKLKKIGRTLDLVMHPADPAILYLALTEVPAPGPPAAVFKSTDGGLNWRPLYDPKHPQILDINVGVTATQPETIYVLITSVKSKTPQAVLMLSTDGGDHWANLGAPAIDITGAGYMYVDPRDAKTIYVGTRDLFKSVDGGLTWTNLTKNWQPGRGGWKYDPANATSHSDQHAFAFSTDSSRIVYIGNDGGLSRSKKGGSSFKSLNSTLSLAQLNSITMNSHGPITFAGTQDNGALTFNGHSRQLIWTEFAAGDSGCCVLVPADPTVVIESYVYGFLNRFYDNGRTDGGNITTNATFQEPDQSPRIAFYPPFIADSLTGKLYFGTWRLFVSSNQGSSWQLVNKEDLTKGRLGNFPDVLTVIAVSPTKRGVIYTGSAQGRAMVTQDGGETWSDITAGLPDRFIKSIVVDRADQKTAYLTVSGTSSGHVFKTTDSGATWQDISRNLGHINQIPVNTLLIDPADGKTLYIGTDVGVFRSIGGVADWTPFNFGLPPVIATGFSTNASGKVQLATYGRGAYELRQ